MARFDIRGLSFAYPGSSDKALDDVSLTVERGELVALMGEKPLDTVKAILVAVVTGGIFLPLAIRIFDRKDVK